MALQILAARVTLPEWMANARADGQRTESPPLIGVAITGFDVVPVLVFQFLPWNARPFTWFC